MKLVKKYFSSILILILAISLTGCMPPEFTKEHAKELAREHQGDATQWFAANRPDAKIGKKCTSVDDGVNLYSLIKGTYKESGKTHNYIYNYDDGVMYLDENYAEACDLITQLTCERMGLVQERSTFHFEGLDIPAVSQNDEPDAYYPAQSSITANSKKVLPADFGAQQFAEAAVDGNTAFEYSIWNYGEVIPAFDPSVFEKFPNLMSIDYFAPVQLEGGGQYSSIWYDATWKCDRYCYLEKASEDMYVGYTYMVDDRGAVSADVSGEESICEMPGQEFSYSEKGDGEIELTIPEDADILIFSTKKRKFTQHFVNSAGKNVTENLVTMQTRDCPGMKGHIIYGACLVVPEQELYGYSLPGKPFVKGHYLITMK